MDGPGHENEKSLLRIWWVPIALQVANILIVCILAVAAALGAGYFLGRMDGAKEERLRNQRAIESLEKRAPCEGCFDSLKWRVDELRALHGIGVKGVEEPEASRENASGTED